LTPSGILHIAAFVTLCEAYMGMEPHFNLWNYFFHMWLQSDSDVEAAMWGYADIYVRTGQGVDLYFHLSISNPSVGQRKELFFLRNDASALLPVVTGKRPTF
jgi:hypothetical protein